MKATCSLDGCGRDAFAKGWCRTHYNRARLNNGDPGPAEIMTKVRGRECSFDGCRRKHDSNGLCAGHNYQRKNGMELRPLEARRDRSERDEQGRKLCIECRTHRPVSDFHRNRNAGDGLAVACTSCTQDRRLVRSYGLTLDEYRQRLEAQGGGCAICGQQNENGRALAVDHDHSCCPGSKSCGTCVRGLLCSNCNMAIGLMQDRPQRLRDAADYLARVTSSR